MKIGVVIKSVIFNQKDQDQNIREYQKVLAKLSDKERRHILRELSKVNSIDLDGKIHKIDGKALVERIRRHPLHNRIRKLFRR